MTTAHPLAGRRVLVGRAQGQQGALAARIRDLGGEPVQVPLIVIEPGDVDQMHVAAGELHDGQFTAVCLTSPNGVDALAAALAARQLPSTTVLHAEIIACVGHGTARALHDRLGIEPTLVPPSATTKSLAAAFPEGTGRVLLPRADIANPVLATILAQKGYDPVDVVAYRTASPPDIDDDIRRQLADGSIDLLAFASSSTVRHFAALVGPQWQGAVVSIGPVTTATCVEHGIDVAVEAAQHDLDGLVAALVEAAQ